MKVAYTNKRIEICSDINTEISEVDNYTWTFTSRIFRLALEITFYLTSIFSNKWLTSYSHKVENLICRGALNKSGRLEIFLKKKISGGTLIRDPRVRGCLYKKNHPTQVRLLTKVRSRQNGLFHYVKTNLLLE